MLRLVSQDPVLDFDDVLMVPQRTTLHSRSEVKLERTFKFYHSPREWTGIPIISSNMSCVTGLKMARYMQANKMIACLHKYYTAEELCDAFFYNSKPLCTDYAWVSIGYSDADLEKLILFSGETGIEPNICIDVPSGYLENFVKFCAKVREEFEDSIIMAGNVCTGDMVQELIISGGVDIVKCQINPGASCNTRYMTGVGYGTISCVAECSHVAHGLKNGDKKLGLVCSDGGCKTAGDIAKGYGAGADFIMLGNMLSGFEQNDDVADTITEDGEEYQIVYGMSTHYAQNKHGNGIKKYRASEGLVRKVPYKGDLETYMQEYLGGVRSACTYIGATSVKDMPKCAKFVKVINKNDNRKGRIAE